MQNSQNPSTRAKSTMFVDYKPAELKIGKDWLIVYYSKHPVTGRLERQRLRVPVISNKKERLKHGNKIVAEINRKLAADWSPYLESPGKIYRSCPKARKGVDGKTA